ncbi:hypothetical protein [Iningainema tapete]|nr:hypothetical protein [Iningainema tapete]
MKFLVWVTGVIAYGTPKTLKYVGNCIITSAFKRLEEDSLKRQIFPSVRFGLWQSVPLRKAVLNASQKSQASVEALGLNKSESIP